MGVYYLQNSDHDAVFNLSVSEMDILNERRDYVLDHSHEEHVDGHGSDQDGMGMGLFGFLFISLLLIVSLVVSLINRFVSTQILISFTHCRYHLDGAVNE